MFENGQLTVLNMNDILPNRFQPRIRFDEEKLEELAESIGKYGVIQPIVVRPIGNKFEIIAGERRYKASMLANRSTIPAIVVNLSDKDSEEIALLENVQRQELSPIEEAVSYKRILDMGYITQEGLAKKLGKSQSTIANKIRLLNLDDEVQSYLLNNRISERHARSLLRIPNKDKQVEMLHRIVEERLTVKQTDREIEKLKENMNIENIVQKPVDIDIPKKEDSISSEIESLFDETDNIVSKENEGGNKMDIDKIMREAKDINVPIQEEPKDISSLMEQKNDVQSEPIVREESIKPINNVEDGKFINVVSNPEPVSSEPQNSTNNGVTFDSMFNQPVSLETSNQVSSVSADVSQANTVNNIQSNVTSPSTSNEVQPSMNVTSPSTSNEVQPSMNVISPSTSNEVQPNMNVISPSTLNEVQPSMNVTSPSTSNEFQPNMNVISPSTSNEVQPSMNVISPSTLNEVQPNMNVISPSTLNEVQPNMNISSQNVVTAPTQNNDSNEVSEDTRKVISNAVAVALKKYNESKANKNTKNLGQSEPTRQEQPNVGINNESNLVNQNSPISDIPEVSFPNVTVPNTDIIDSSNTTETIASNMSQNIKPVTNQASFAQIVKMLRECADKIEQSGYFVNVDELDLGNQYKVTFTIDKE